MLENLIYQLEEVPVSDFSVADAESLFRITRKIAAHRMDTLQEITSSDKVASLLCELCRGDKNEHFGVIYLNTKHRIIHIDPGLFVGTVNAAAVYPRRVAEEALLRGAAAVVFWHNHPSGDPEPSAADHAITAQLKDALSLLDVRVLDHLVVGSHRWVSLASRGVL